MSSTAENGFKNEDIRLAPAQDGPMRPAEYFEVFTNLLRSPSAFFRNCASDTGWKRSATFLSISALFNAAVSAAFFGGSPTMGAVILGNNIFMPTLAAVMTFMVLSLFFARIRFSSVFSVHAYASGLLLAVSWIPGLSMVLEPIRAVIVCVGLVRVCRLKWWQSALAVCAAAFLVIVLFQSVAPLLVS